MQTDLLEINNEKIPVSILKSANRKRSLSFKVSNEGLIIRTPVRFSYSLIDKFLSKKQDWIYQCWVNKKKNALEKRSFVD